MCTNFSSREISLSHRVVFAFNSLRRAIVETRQDKTSVVSTLLSTEEWSKRRQNAISSRAVRTTSSHAGCCWYSSRFRNSKSPGWLQGCLLWYRPYSLRRTTNIELELETEPCFRYSDRQFMEFWFSSSSVFYTSLVPVWVWVIQWNDVILLMQINYYCNLNEISIYKVQSIKQSKREKIIRVHIFEKFTLLAN